MQTFNQTFRWKNFNNKHTLARLQLPRSECIESLFCNFYADCFTMFTGKLYPKIEIFQNESRRSGIHSSVLRSWHNVPWQRQHEWITNCISRSPWIVHLRYILFANNIRFKFERYLIWSCYVVVSLHTMNVTFFAYISNIIMTFSKSLACM